MTVNVRFHNPTAAELDGYFSSGLFNYDLGEEGVPSHWFDWASASHKFLLKRFLEAESPRAGNCMDVSGFNSICMASLGEAASLVQQIQEDGFETNPVAPIGSDGLGPYGSLTFTMHQQAHLASKVYDAALTFEHDLSGGTYCLPPTDWPMPDYWQTPVGPSPPPLYGLTRRYAGSASDSETVTFSSASFSYPGVK